MSIVDLNTNMITGSITGFNGPTGIALTSDTDTAYVTNYGNNTLNIVDLSTNMITGSITGFNMPAGIAITSD
ncbi:YncE family protein, partial [Bacillus toyonensis]|uniref:YncE family protein n=1 Tax=Bacillus toyonensis TaxID=155322 RepID=UPI003AA7B8DF